jgi:hypothetical protein
MVGIPHEKHDKEDLEVKFAHMEKNIATLTKLVTQLLVKKDKEENLAEIKHEQDKVH